jgi:hypothetical protein
MSHTTKGIRLPAKKKGIREIFFLNSMGKLKLRRK